jgi:hypothetical protein
VSDKVENCSKLNSFCGAGQRHNSAAKSLQHVAGISCRFNLERVALRLLRFALAFLHSVGCGKLPISVWLGAQGTGMQFTSFLGGCTTRGTRHGQNLLQGEFLGFHRAKVQRSRAGKCSKLLSFDTLTNRPVSVGLASGFQQ